MIIYNILVDIRTSCQHGAIFFVVFKTAVCFDMIS